jgi:CheY-like chemotaxis protein
MWKRSLTIALEPWAHPERPRVLIEHPDPDSQLELAAALRRVGCTIGICRGPDATADPVTRCPMHRLEPCISVEGADVVVTALDLEQRDGAEVVRGLRTLYPRTPLVVLATVAETLELGDVLEGCTVLPVDDDPARIATAVLDRLPRAASA